MAAKEGRLGHITRKILEHSKKIYETYSPVIYRGGGNYLEIIGHPYLPSKEISDPGLLNAVHSEITKELGLGITFESGIRAHGVKEGESGQFHGIVGMTDESGSIVLHLGAYHKHSVPSPEEYPATLVLGPAIPSMKEKYKEVLKKYEDRIREELSHDAHVTIHVTGNELRPAILVWGEAAHSPEFLKKVIKIAKELREELKAQ